jgi:hypothetical protein
MPLPETPAEDARDLILAPLEPEPVRARPERRPPPPPPPSTNDLLAELVRSRPATAAAPSAEEVALAAEEREALVEEIVRDLLSDPDAAFRSIAVLYQDFLVRLRIKRVPGEAPTLAAFKKRLSVARAGVEAGAIPEDSWARAEAAAADLPEEIQGVYLLLARAAFEGAPCPPDGAIARACGSRSPGRARRLVQYMESRGHVVTRADLRGQRIIALPDLGVETKAGDPNAWEEPQEGGGDLFATG